MKKILVLSLILVGCGSSTSTKHRGAEAIADEGTVLIDTIRSEVLTSCESGAGVTIRTGVDANLNQVLDNGEVLSTSYVCDGKNEEVVTGDGSGSEKIKICHKNGKTLELPQEGDELGECK
jgi:hypothetical protein